MHKEMQLKFIIYLCVFISFIFFIPNIEARELLPPRFSANAYTGVYTVGQADLMVSLDGEQQHNLYINPQGAYGSDQQWYCDLGLGYRWIKNDAAILGWYLFAGRTRVANHSSFWITNPGVEVMGSRWDARINAYIPVAGRSNELGIEEFNIVSVPFFTGHTEVINTVFDNENAIQQIGNGADARVGYQFFRQVPLKGYVGAYLFAIPNTDNIRGGAAGLEYWFDDNIRVFANYSYDNYQHSKVIGGLGISFGGVRKHWADPSLSERLMDPVERYLANLGHGSGIPSKTLLYGMGPGSRPQLVINDIAFFSQTGTPNDGGTTLTLANCTFENPCGPTDFSQTGVDTLNTLLPNTVMYFNGGSYEANNGGADPLTLNNGQSLHSRTTDYTAAAIGAARSTFIGGFDLPGNNQLDSVILDHSGGIVDEAIFSEGPNIVINNSQIGVSMINPYESGLDLDNASVRLNQSTVFAETGFILSNTSSLRVQSSDITIVNGMDPTVNGLVLSGGSNAEINDSQLTVVGDVSVEVFGILTGDTSRVLINRSNIKVMDIHTPPPVLPNAVGLQTTGSSQIQMNEGSLSVSGNTTSELTSGTNIFLNGVLCTLNGVTVSCP